MLFITSSIFSVFSLNEFLELRDDISFDFKTSFSNANEAALLAVRFSVASRSFQCPQLLVFAFRLRLRRMGVRRRLSFLLLAVEGIRRDRDLFLD